MKKIVLVALLFVTAPAMADYQDVVVCQKTAQVTAEIIRDIHKGEYTEQKFYAQTTDNRVIRAAYRAANNSLYETFGERYTAAFEKCHDIFIKMRVYGPDSQKVQDAYNY